MDINDAWLNNPYLSSNPIWEPPLFQVDNYEHNILNPEKDIEWDPDKTCKCLDCDYEIKNKLSKIKTEMDNMNSNIVGINNNIVSLCNVIKELKLDLPKKRNHEEMVDYNRLYIRGPYKKRRVQDKNGHFVNLD